MNAKTSGVIEKIDALLDDDKSFTTRTGLRFMTSVMRDALAVVGDIAEKNDGVNNRLSEMEKAFLSFMTQQSKKEAAADEERKKWRWAIIAPVIGILLAEIARLIFH